MKKVYNIPSTETVACQGSFICQSGSADPGMNIGGNSGLGNGGQGDNIDPM